MLIKNGIVWALRAVPAAVLAGMLLWPTTGGQSDDQEALKQRQMLEDRLRDEAQAAATFVRSSQAGTEGRLKEILGQQVDQTHQVMTDLWAQLDGLLPPETVAAVLREGLRNARFFDGRGYYFIDTLDGLCVLLPTAPRLEGTSLWDNRDDQGTYIMRSLVDAARQPEGGGYVRYRWYSPLNPDEMADKIAYARLFEPLNWVIGAGEYVVSLEDTVRSDALRRLRAIRFGSTGGVGILDASGVPLAFPETARHQTTDSTEAAAGLTAREKALSQTLVDLAKSGGGVITFDWPTPDLGRSEPRMAFVLPFSTWGWTVYASAQVADAVPSVARSAATPSTLRIWVTLIALLVIVILVRPRDEVP